MSIFRRVFRGIRRIVGRAAPVIGAVNPLLGVAAGAIGTTVRTVGTLPAAQRPTFAPAVLPGAGLAALPTIARGAGLAVGAGVRGARAVARSASIYCRRHPAWCASVGGLAAVAGMVETGQLPPVRRRRTRGISGTDLNRFRRVASFLRAWGPMCASGAARPRRRKC